MIGRGIALGLVLLITMCSIVMGAEKKQSMDDTDKQSTAFYGKQSVSLRTNINLQIADIEKILFLDSTLETVTITPEEYEQLLNTDFEFSSPEPIIPVPQQTPAAPLIIAAMDQTKNAPSQISTTNSLSDSNPTSRKKTVTISRTEYERLRINHVSSPTSTTNPDHNPTPDSPQKTATITEEQERLVTSMKPSSSPKSTTSTTQPPSAAPLTGHAEKLSSQTPPVNHSPDLTNRHLWGSNNFRYQVALSSVSMMALYCLYEIVRHLPQKPKPEITRKIEESIASPIPVDPDASMSKG